MKDKKMAIKVHAEILNCCNLRLVDAAVVKDKVDAGKLFAGLLGFQIELHNTFVTCTKQKHKS